MNDSLSEYKFEHDFDWLRSRAQVNDIVAWLNRNVDDGAYVAVDNRCYVLGKDDDFWFASAMLFKHEDDILAFKIVFGI